MGRTAERCPDRFADRTWPCTVEVIARNRHVFCGPPAIRYVSLPLDLDRLALRPTRVWVTGNKARRDLNPVRQVARSAMATGRLAARIAGNRPPMNPSAQANAAPRPISGGVT